MKRSLRFSNPASGTSFLNLVLDSARRLINMPTKAILVLVGMLSIASALNGQALTTDAFNGGPYCLGQTVTVPWTYTAGGIIANRTLQVQYSSTGAAGPWTDAAGASTNITNANTTNAAGSIPVVLTNTTSFPQGGNYRFRVITRVLGIITLGPGTTNGSALTNSRLPMSSMPRIPIPSN